MSRLAALLGAAVLLVPAAAAPPEPERFGEPADLPPGLTEWLRTGRPEPPEPGPPSPPPSGQDRRRMLKEFGGNEESERAVALGLAWLARQQKADGRWEFPGTSAKETAAATGMCLLPFIAAGETHKGAKKYKKTVEAGLNWLLKDQAAGGKDAGRFASAGTMYGQAIAALAVVESYAATGDPVLKPRAQAAVDFIQKAQAADGSWGYTPAADRGDTSILGWQLQVLHAAKLARLDVDGEVVKKALAFLDAVAGGEKKSAYKYVPQGMATPGSAMTASGLWCRAFVGGWDADHPGLAAGAAGLAKRAPDGKQPDPYFTHYAARVLRFRGGGDWRTWNEGTAAADGTRTGGMRDTLVKLQVKKDGADHGSWDPDDGYIGRCCGRHGTTALNVLALEVYYLPLPKKGEKPPQPDR